MASEHEHFEESYSDEISRMKSLRFAEPSQDWKTRARGELLRYMIDNPASAKRTFTWHYRLASLSFMLLIVSGITGGVGLAAQNSLPDDGLYPVKRAAEKIHYLLTPQAEDKAELKAKLAKRRQDEVQTLIHLKPERVAEKPEAVLAVLNENRVEVEGELARLKEEVLKLRAERDRIAAAVAQHQEEVIEEPVEIVILTVENINPADHIGGAAVMPDATSTDIEVASEGVATSTDPEFLEEEDPIALSLPKELPKAVKDALINTKKITDELEVVRKEAEELKKAPTEEPAEEEPVVEAVQEPAEEETLKDKISTSTPEVVKTSGKTEVTKTTEE